MDIQLIIVVETNKECDSDWMYIYSAINYFYNINQDVKLTPVYMNGKSNYCKRSVTHKIEYYKSSKKNANNVVVYCFDIDNDDYENAKRNDEINEYCISNGYELIWFNKDIEDVFLGKSVNKRIKGEEATRFVRKNEINNIKEMILNDRKINRHRSNLLMIIDKYLKRR